MFLIGSAGYSRRFQQNLTSLHRQVGIDRGKNVLMLEKCSGSAFDQCLFL